MLDTNLDSNLISDSNSANLDEYFSSTVIASNNHAMMPTTSGTSQNDLIDASQIDRTTYGLEGNDFIWGSLGKNVLFGNNGNDIIQGKEDDDLLNGGADIDYLTGNEGNDSLVGGSNFDLLVGDVGNDRLQGESGDDYLTGGEDNDYLDGGAGLDLLQGDAGNDIFVDEDGGDRFIGGEGADEFRIGSPQANKPNAIADFEIGTDKLKVLRIGANFEGLKIEDSQDGATIFDGKKNIGILQGIKANALSQDNFIFADPQLSKTFQQEISKGIEETNLPGVSAAVILPDGTSWLGSEGYNNREAGTFLNPSDRFYIASITKSFTATTILQLAQENKLNLDDTLDKWLPDTANHIANGDRITIKQLLSHTSGIVDYDTLGRLNTINDLSIRAKLIEDPAISVSARDVLASLKDKPITLDPEFLQQNPDFETLLDDSFLSKVDIYSPAAQQFLTPEQKIATVYGQPADFKPGSDYSYSNTNYLLLGEIIEKATGSSISQQFRERIIEPLGMANTFFAPEEEVSGSYVNNYKDLDGDGNPDDITNKFPQSFQMSGTDGGIVTTPADLSRFARGLFKGELLAPETLEQMTSEAKEGANYGLGLELDDNPQLGKNWGHGGGTLGWDTNMFYFRDRDLTVVVNRNGYETNIPNSSDIANHLAEKATKSSPSRK